LLQNQRSFAVGAWVKMRNTLREFIQCLLNAGLIGWQMV